MDSCTWEGEKILDNLHLGGREVGILQSKSQLLSLLGVERDHLFINNYESSSNTSEPYCKTVKK